MLDKSIIKSTILSAICFGLLNISCNGNSSNSAEKAKENDSAVKLKKEIKVSEVAINEDSLKFVRKPFQYDTTKTYIYLTFDDGPHGGTNDCFDVCKKNGIKATFFMVGRHSLAKGGTETVKKIRNSYPEFLLANHTFSHANEHYKFFYQHPEMASQDIFQAQQVLNVPYKIVRLAGNSAWVRKSELKSSHLVNAVCHKLDSAGYNVIGWDVEWNFARGTSFPVQSAEKMVSVVNNAAEGKTHHKNHVVILSHDRMFRTPQYADSLNKFISILKQNPKYVFETIDNYPDLRF